jgi:hypothetical protein
MIQAADVAIVCGILFLILLLLWPFTRKDTNVLPCHCFRVIEAKQRNHTLPNEAHKSGVYVRWLRNGELIASKLSLRGPLTQVVLDTRQLIGEIDDDLECEVSECRCRVAKQNFDGFEGGVDGVMLTYQDKDEKSKKLCVFPKNTQKWTKEKAKAKLSTKVGEDAFESSKLIFFRFSPPNQITYREYKSTSSFSYMNSFTITILILALVYLRISAATYNIKINDFEENYLILDLPPFAPFTDVKKAWRMLGRKYHPDKNPGCVDCAEKYMQISNAYEQINDYDKGKLKIIDEPHTMKRRKH